MKLVLRVFLFPIAIFGVYVFSPTLRGIPAAIGQITTNGQADSIVIEGDSLSNGSVGSPTNPRIPGDWVSYISSYLNWYSAASVFNIATAGEQVKQMLTEYPTQAQPHKPAAGKKAYYIVYGGINDVQGSSVGPARTASETYADLKTLWSLARADGFTVVAFTIHAFYPFSKPPQSEADAVNAERIALNTLILSDPSKYDILVRMDQVFPNTMPSATDPNFADRLHTNEAGAKIFAQAVATAIQNGGGATTGNTTGQTTGATTGNTTGQTTGVTTGAYTGGCTERYTSGVGIPTGYGAAFNVFSGYRELLLRTTCNSTGDVTLAVNTPDTVTKKYVSKNGFRWNGFAWIPITFTGTPVVGAPDWLEMGASAVIKNSDLIPGAGYTFFAAYSCTFANSKWNCGCRDSFCGTSLWQLQAIHNSLAYNTTGSGTTGATTAGTTGATTGTTGGTGGPLPTEFAAINECGSTVNVTPSTLSSNIGNGCKILVMAPGVYNLNFTGHSGGVLTMRCATKGACEVRTGSEIQNSSGILIDGIVMDGHCTSGCHTAPTSFLTLTNVSNIRIQNSTFNNMIGTGVLVNQADENKQFNIQLVSNTIHNDLDNRFKMSNGNGYSYDMDYGFRIHDANSVYIAYNTFSGGFNHATSLKRLVKYALIEHNTFVSCGRACIHAGQQGNMASLPNISSGLIEVKNNTFGGGNSAWGLVVMNVHKVVATNNTFTGFNNSNNFMTSGTNNDSISAAMYYHIFQDGYNGLSGYINQGIPSDRQLIQSGNVFN